MAVTLYHFTPLHMAPMVEQAGLIWGRTPIVEAGKRRLMPHTPATGFIAPTQWLTVSPAFSAPWCDFESGDSTLSYDRQAVRFVVTVPEHERVKLYAWSDFKKAFLRDCMVNCFDDTPDAVNWYIFSGCIPPSWLSNKTFKGS